MGSLTFDGSGELIGHKAASSPAEVSLSVQKHETVQGHPLPHTQSLLSSVPSLV